ncbi:helix-turn-helix domain-containing protein [Nocardia miyunensis]|uniref:helix-turn-helix domain-containing protein n=1 Tax=Nocardia miyunensis TaxID=282684 RepID=UPI000829A273|nr:AraC family transcriptional regulator [Nocardia miyunensis]
MSEPTRVVRHQRGVPVYDYRSDPATPPVSTMRYPGSAPSRQRHIHDFPALWYVSTTGAVHVVAAGQVVDGAMIDTLGSGVGVFFDPGALGDDARAPWPVWRSHPLLYPFLHAQRDGLLELTVPRARRPLWDSTIEAIETELSQRQDGYRQAACAHLTLLLIDLARLAADVVGDLRRSGEPLLAEVFEVIDERYADQLSLRDVAQAVGMTPGYLTTVVRRRTGRTVQDWILQRRMDQARRLLSGTDLPIAEIARRTGVSDPGYFSRQFRRTFGTPPRAWRASPPR